MILSLCVGGWVGVCMCYWLEYFIVSCSPPGFVISSVYLSLGNFCSLRLSKNIFVPLIFIQCKYV